MDEMGLIDEMLLHEQALEQYPWLSAQILNRWRRDGVIRCFKGKEGRAAYPKSDLSKALAREMECEKSDSQEGYSNTAGNGSAKRREETASTATGTMTEADALREKLWRQSLYKTQKKNSSGSLAPKSRHRETPEKSISSTS
ncbi:hypothetical protein ACLMJV_16860 [Sinorhizobium meliloti]|uniref:hypothetical protein n=1 Tax=Rhizobium meliloti TaxID=382 RepID=UPI00398C83A9